MEPNAARSTLFFLLWGILFAAFWAVPVVLSSPRDFHSNPALLDWIPATCCVTNDCCWEISEREFDPSPE